MFKAKLNRFDNHSMKFNAFNKDLLPMWVADMDFESPDCIKQALINRLQQSDLGYTKPWDELNNSIVNWCKTQYNWEIQPDWIAWLPGIVSGFNMACNGFNKGKVIVQSPNYPPMLQAAKLSEQTSLPLFVTLNEHTQRWMFDFEQLEQHLSEEQCGLFLLCNPMNPHGTMLTETEIKRIVKLCHQYDVQLCSDEIHCDLALEHPHFPAGKFDSKAITLMAASKTFNIAGLGCSFAIIENKQIRHRFVNQMKGLVSWPSNLGLEATYCAFSKGQQWRLALIEQLKLNRNKLVTTLNQFKLNDTYVFKTQMNDASFLCWIDCTTLESITSQPALNWFKSAGIMPSNGVDFGAPGFIRINFGCPEQTVDHAIEKIQTHLTRTQSMLDQ